jgi:predicted transcriptional regulator of viral defense system
MITLVKIRSRDLPDHFLARGQHWVTTSEIASELGVSLVAARQAASRWQQKGLAFSPTRGAYVLIPPQFRTWRAVPASHFVDDMMRFLGHTYYVGYLSAAEIHDAGHQRPQTFQVVTNQRLQPRTFGRIRMEFICHSDSSGRPTNMFNTPTGTICVSTAEATVFDLVSAPKHSGGLSNVATVIADLMDDGKLDMTELIRIAPLWPTTVVQRTGWLIEFVSHELDRVPGLDPLAAVATKNGNPCKLLPSGNRGPLDARWNIVINTQLELDR